MECVPFFPCVFNTSRKAYSWESRQIYLGFSLSSFSWLSASTWQSTDLYWWEEKLPVDHYWDKKNSMQVKWKLYKVTIDFISNHSKCQHFFFLSSLFFFLFFVFEYGIVVTLWYFIILNSLILLLMCKVCTAISPPKQVYLYQIANFKRWGYPWIVNELMLSNEQNSFIIIKNNGAVTTAKAWLQKAIS